MAEGTASIENHEDTTHTIECQYSDFCDKQACVLATELCNAWNVFKGTNSNFTNVDAKDVQNKFIEFFPRHFESAIASNVVSPNKLTNGIYSMSNSANHSAAADDTIDAFSTNEEAAPRSPPPRAPAPRPFFRKLSFRGLRKRKGLFLKSHNDDAEFSPQQDKINGKYSMYITL